ncbi:uncharacterized protein Z518_02720 [Rhinocladiella mackenziei CBS 650.93]|uniref:Uncharacterized protein n=1 Tax=Rhinocladiella mackenziei CBS 650.93 TaxID=1442369 RepID=A0A0D2JFM0_9EURO|nr:uncharacterized protein Z518_02720 [Rhinocladiella mackenziei CBS 650.93]KIX08065.1 hypothetical protein Z518_02720 [Rhinocladiella mackenziei CBS 650.93]
MTKSRLVAVSLGAEAVVRRPILTLQPFLARFIGGLATLLVLAITLYVWGSLLISIRDAFRISAFPAPIGAVGVYIFGPLFAMFVYDLIRQQVAVFQYLRWLRGSENEADRRWKIADRLLSFDEYNSS